MGDGERGRGDRGVVGAIAASETASGVLAAPRLQLSSRSR